MSITVFAGLVFLIAVHDPSDNILRINPAEIIMLRPAPLERRGNYDEKVHCLINLADGKAVAVMETCEQVRDLIEGTGK